jgi:hypothetical protein
MLAREEASTPGASRVLTEKHSENEREKQSDNNAYGNDQEQSMLS